jgi:hypothetical protein
MSQGSLLGIYSDQATGWRAGNRDSISRKPSRYICSTKQTYRLWIPPSLQFNAYRRLFLEGKPLRREAKHTPPYTAKVKNEWSCNFTAHMPSRLAHYNFTLLHVLYHQSLNFQSLNITLRAIRFNIQKFYIVLTLRLCVLNASHRRQRLLPYTALADCF